MKFGFVTCVQLGLSCMEAIYEIGGKLDLVITLEDEQAKEKSGRVYLDSFCNEKRIKLHKSSHINNEDCTRLIRELKIDWLFIIGWSQIASKSVLEQPRKGVLGIHPTLLPIGRGRAAIPWAILKNLDKTGVTLIKLNEGVDTGDIIAQAEIALNRKTNATSLYKEVNKAHITLIKNVFHELKSDNVSVTAQDDSIATEWPGRKPEDGLINLNGSIEDAERLVRAVTKPYPGAFYYEGDKKIIVWSAAIRENTDCVDFLLFKDGVLELIEYEEI
ncbi:formyltransferase family protein [Aliikangiella sp. IMCC44359]|uniref:formyltransferase family protein n=1 Tax=Aliikangiella sp. IMCC44359 TaxID=3459125 RepID=UPI00403AAB2F